jgi:hypothetical protein
MKAERWIGPIVTGLMAASILLSAIADLLRVSGAVSVIRHLGYPAYLLVFLGTAMTLGVLAVLGPGVPPRLKEWAFAGPTFDVTGALYSHVSVGDPAAVWTPAAVGLVLTAVSYAAFRTRERRTVAS